MSERYWLKGAITGLVLGFVFELFGILLADSLGLYRIREMAETFVIIPGIFIFLGFMIGGYLDTNKTWKKGAIIGALIPAILLVTFASNCSGDRCAGNMLFLIGIPIFAIIGGIIGYFIDKR